MTHSLRRLAPFSIAVLILACGGGACGGGTAGSSGAANGAQSYHVRMTMEYGDAGSCRRPERNAECREMIAPLLAQAKNAATDDREQATRELADAHQWLSSGNAALVWSRESAEDSIRADMAPEDLFDLPRWSGGAPQHAVDLNQLQAPHWEDETLVYEVLIYPPARILNRSISGERRRVTFSANGWEIDQERLDSAPFEMDEVTARVQAAFGGPITAYVSATLSGNQHLLLGLGAEDGQSRFLLGTSTESARQFSTWPELISANPDMATGENLAAMMEALRSFYSEGTNLNLIRDGAAYQTQYRAEGWEEERLRVRHDDIEVTRFTVDLSQVTSPSVSGTTATAHFEDNQHQPVRLVVDLNALPASAAMLPLATAERVGEATAPVR